MIHNITFSVIFVDSESINFTIFRILLTIKKQLYFRVVSDCRQTQEFEFAYGLFSFKIIKVNEYSVFPLRMDTFRGLGRAASLATLESCGLDFPAFPAGVAILLSNNKFLLNLLEVTNP